VRDHAIDARRVHVVGYGRNVDLRPPRDRDWSTPRFLFVGNDWSRKNGDTVVRAFVRIHREVPTARLDIVSNHPAIGVDGIVEHGSLAKQGSLAVFDPEARPRLEELFAEATCFVMPSLFEPWGLVYVEAAAAGVASIAGSIGGTADSVGEGGVIVDPYDEDALFRAMRALCDPDTAQHLGVLAHARSAALTWSQTTQRVLQCLNLGSIPGVEPSPLS
jgi:glycosyltransferase involved in cell wall biosynthesis